MDDFVLDESCSITHLPCIVSTNVDVAVSVVGALGAGCWHRWIRSALLHIEGLGLCRRVAGGSIRLFAFAVNFGCCVDPLQRVSRPFCFHRGGDHRWRQRFKRATGVESVRFLLVVVVDSIKRVGLMGRHVAGDVGMGCKPGISRALYVFNEILEDPYA